jgi:CBS domain-containing protein
MTVEDVMSRDVVTVAPQTTIEAAAVQMKTRDIGILPVTENGRIVGVLTDRDIAIRGSAGGMDPRSTAVLDIMTPQVIQCLGTQTLQEAGDLMESNHVRRVIVTNEDKNVIGVLSLDDLAKKVRNPILTNEVIREVSTVQPDKP